MTSYRSPIHSNQSKDSKSEMCVYSCRHSEGEQCAGSEEMTFSPHHKILCYFEEKA